jgi:hypothetical protein
MILETVRVLNPSGDGHMIINAKDFDPSVHKTIKEKTTMVKATQEVHETIKPEAVAVEEKTVEAPKKGRPPTKNNDK